MALSRSGLTDSIRAMTPETIGDEKGGALGRAVAVAGAGGEDARSGCGDLQIGAVLREAGPSVGSGSWRLPP